MIRDWLSINVFVMHKPDILCLQETKSRVMSEELVEDVWGCQTSSCLVLPSFGAFGGILIIWDDNKIEMMEHEIGAFSISIKCKFRLFAEEWMFVRVYGPPKQGEVVDFMVELDDIKGRWNLPWCIGGDFNMVRCPLERSGDGRRDISMD